MGIGPRSSICRRTDCQSVPREFASTDQPNSGPWSIHAERDPFMSPSLRWPMFALVMVVGLHPGARAAELPGGVKLQPFVRPKKSSSTQDRAFEYVQKTAD